MFSPNNVAWNFVLTAANDILPETAQAVVVATGSNLWPENETETTGLAVPQPYDGVSADEYTDPIALKEVERFEDEFIDYGDCEDEAIPLPAVLAATQPAASAYGYDTAQLLSEALSSNSFFTVTQFEALLIPTESTTPADTMSTSHNSQVETGALDPGSPNLQLRRSTRAADKRKRDVEDNLEEDNMSDAEYCHSQEASSPTPGPSCKRQRIDEQDTDTAPTLPVPGPSNPEKKCGLDGKCTYTITGNFAQDRTHLNTHNLTTEDKLYPCTFPGCAGGPGGAAGYLHKHDRNRHIMSAHWAGHVAISCSWPGCPRRFSRQDDLARHLRKHAKKTSKKASTRTKKQ